MAPRRSERAVDWPWARSTPRSRLQPLGAADAPMDGRPRRPKGAASCQGRHPPSSSMTAHLPKRCDKAATPMAQAALQLPQPGTKPPVLLWCSPEVCSPLSPGDPARGPLQTQGPGNWRRFRGPLVILREAPIALRPSHPGLSVLGFTPPLTAAVCFGWAGVGPNPVRNQQERAFFLFCFVGCYRTTQL